ncbi:SDR family oxidoreductase [Kitasatospora sp. RG8]|nr:SDR family oxidoreductase [Kitasatospora sp. RG8]
MAAARPLFLAKGAVLVAHPPHPPPQGGRHHPGHQANVPHDAPARPGGHRPARADHRDPRRGPARRRQPHGARPRVAGPDPTWPKEEGRPACPRKVGRAAFPPVSASVDAGRRRPLYRQRLGLTSTTPRHATALAPAPARPRRRRGLEPDAGAAQADARHVGEGGRGITVTVVDPGPVDTDMNPAGGDSAGFQRSLTALGRYGEAEDVAAAVAYLAGPGGRYITGTALAVDGGYTA